MNINKEIFISCLSELRDEHYKVHFSEGSAPLPSQISQANSGKLLGCPICDVGSVVLRDPELTEALKTVGGQAASEILSLTTILGLSELFVLSQAVVLALGVKIGRKLVELEELSASVK